MSTNTETPESVCEQLAAELREQGENLSGADFIELVCGLLQGAGYAIEEPKPVCVSAKYWSYSGGPVPCSEHMLWSKAALYRCLTIERAMRANAFATFGPNSRRFYSRESAGEWYGGCNFESSPSGIVIHKHTGRCFSRSKWSGEDHEITWERALDWANSFWSGLQP